MKAYVAVWAALLLSACGDPPPAAPPPPEVRVFAARPQPSDNIVELPGRVQAVRRAEVRARVDGIVERQLYREGSDVQAGTELFLIDPRELRAALNAAEATLARAQATVANAAQDVARFEGLVADQAISKQEYDAAVARLRTAQADVAQAGAQVESARLNLAYTRVVSPIAGRASRAQVSEGALVSRASATLLTIVEQFDSVHVNFSQSSSAMLEVRREITSGALKVPELGRVVVRLVLEDGRVYPETGYLDFLDLSIDEATGTAALRADFPNPDRMLLPGQFVRARIEAGVRPNAMLIPQRAVQLAPQGASVMIVDAKNAVAERAVKVGGLRGSSWVVLEGLKAGDRVIVDGLQKVQPGMTVRVAESAESAALAEPVATAEPPAQ